MPLGCDMTLFPEYSRLISKIETFKSGGSESKSLRKCLSGDSRLSCVDLSRNVLDNPRGKFSGLRVDWILKPDGRGMDLHRFPDLVLCTVHFTILMSQNSPTIAV